MKVNLLVLMIVILSLNLSGQSEKKMIREGNKLYDKGVYDEAAINYQKVMDQNPMNDKAVFNHGSAISHAKTSVCKKQL